MSKRNEEYWRDRAIEREAYWNKQSRDKVEKALARQYYNSMRRIQDDIAALYGRFADENGLSPKEARKLLEGNEFRQWRMSLEEYTRLSATDNAVLRELNTLAMRSRISRLEKIYGQTLVELYKLGKYVEKDMRNFLSDAYKDNYYKGLFEIGKTAGLHGSIGTVSREQLERVLSNPWSGKNYSSRIWNNQQKLAQALKDTVFSGVHRGLSVPKMSKMIQQRMNVGKNEATRLVRTELNYIHNQANLASIEDSGLEFYKFVATLDSRTSQKCRAHDGSIIPVEEASPGDNLPPLHPHCRSTIIGSLGEGKGGQKGLRAARVGKGKTFYVPQQMNYNDYKAVYVDKSKPFGTWAKENGFTGLAAKYTPPAPSQGNPGSGIIEPKEDPLKPKELAGVKRGEEMSFDDANQGRGNSKYRIERGCDINCQSCVVAHEARLRGYDVTAKANFKNPTAERVARQTNLAWINPETQAPVDYITDRTQLYNPKKFMDFMHNTLKEGERYTLEFSWKGRSNYGHIISLYTEKGKIVFYDPQSGRLYKEGTLVNTGGKDKDIILLYLSRLKWQRTVRGYKFYTTPKIMRVDNAVIEPNIAKDILREYEE